jgi:signal transduction histidine kinase
MIGLRRLSRLKPWPRTVGSQLIVVTALAVLLSNAAVMIWFTLGHERDNDTALTERLLDRAAATAVLMNEIPDSTRESALHAFSSNFWGTYTLHKGAFAAGHMTAEEKRLANRLKAMLPPNITQQVAVYRKISLPSPPPEPRFSGPGIDKKQPPPRRGAHLPRPGDKVYEIVVPISADTQLVSTFFYPSAPFWSAPLWLAAIITILFSSVAAAIIAKRVARPLSKLAEAASVAARGGDAPRVPEEGPNDVRNAAVAFNAMNDQVSRTMESQRHLLSAVGHDLRTPITAMRINLEFVKDTDIADRLRRNLDELQALTEAVLSAAHGASGEKQRRVDLFSLVDSLCADLDDLKIPVFWHGGEPAPLPCRANEIRRAVRNLIENAVAYGKKAEVSLQTLPDAYEIRVEDEGPGIPEKDRERVFEPFVRLESSRNAETGGVGLGLTLVKSIAEGHGGSIVLEDRERGGLRVRMILPRRA